MADCPSCGTGNPAEASYCVACGTALSAGPASVALEERKTVTVLFADLVGFTSRSEQMDVEDVRRTLVPYHHLVRRELERFGGTVEKFIGDAVVAIFGAPVSHEDDPQRAVLAALAIQAAVARLREQNARLDLHLRIGVNTGEALVALAVDPGAGEGLASGDVVNTAARLQSAAPPDGVLVGEATFRATDRVIAYEAVDPVVAKGKRQPVAAWRARGELAPGAVEPLRPHQAGLVGRAAELAKLTEALATVCEERRPLLVTLAGVPGIGKSRLVYELSQAAPPDAVFRYGRSLPYGQGTAFWALGEIVRAQAGILHSDRGAAVAAKLHEAVAGAVTDIRDADWIEGQLRPLVGLDAGPGSGADRHAEAFAAWRRFLESVARHRALALVFEDLHWADDALLEFVDRLIEWTVDVPLLVLCTARPELFDRRPGWSTGRPNALVVSLSPLSDADTEQLVAALLADAELPEPVSAGLRERARGNPLYAQEYVRMLLDRGLLVHGPGGWSLAGAADLPLPESLYGIIAARLDALDPEEKAVVQDASVIGKVVWPGAVAYVSGRDRWTVEEMLHRLERRELMRRRRRSSVEAEPEYEFHHALIRDVAYSQIVRRARADRHARAAEWIEQLGDDHGDRAELLAHHYLTALDLRAATGDDPGDLAAQAHAALIEAADRAMAISAFAAAGRSYASAFSLVADEAAIPPQQRYRHARARMYSDEMLPPELPAIASELAAAGDLETAAEAQSDIGIWLDQHGRKEDGLRHLHSAVELLRDQAPSAAKASALSSLASVRVLDGHLDEATRAADEALEIATALGLDDLRAWSHQTIALARLQQQDSRADEEFERAFSIARGLESYDGAMIEHNYGMWLLARGSLADAREVQLEARRRATRLGLAYTARLVDGVLGCIEYHAGAWDRAESLIGRVLEAEGGPAGHGPALEAHTVMARIEMARGDLVSAHRHAARAAALARDMGEPQYLVSSLGVLAHICVATDRMGEATGLIEELLGGAWIAVAISTESLSSAAFAASRLPAVRDRFTAATAAFALPSPWVEAAGALAAGEGARAADLYATIGSLTDEAFARALAGQHEASNLFWRRVGARAYEREL